MWDKGLQALELKPFKIEAEKKAEGGGKPTVRKKAGSGCERSGRRAVEVPPAVSGAGLREFLTRPRDLRHRRRRAAGCAGASRSSRLARKHGYNASTADTIAILHLDAAGAACATGRIRRRTTSRTPR